MVLKVTSLLIRKYFKFQTLPKLVIHAHTHTQTRKRERIQTNTIIFVLVYNLMKFVFIFLFHFDKVQKCKTLGLNVTQF